MRLEFDFFDAHMLPISADVALTPGSTRPISVPCWPGLIALLDGSGVGGGLVTTTGDFLMGEWSERMWDAGNHSDTFICLG